MNRFLFVSLHLHLFLTLYNAVGNDKNTSRRCFEASPAPRRVDSENKLKHPWLWLNISLEAVPANRPLVMASVENNAALEGQLGPARSELLIIRCPPRPRILLLLLHNRIGSSSSHLHRRTRRRQKKKEWKRESKGIRITTKPQCQFLNWLSGTRAPKLGGVRDFV
ncbi:hypothetical protein I7I50_11709 [Histoplasma capsulatum G186AR]|nr:hypothetical protein I7I52_02947 [Histoplasma capsulatum]QSS70163.1 hypothetical protein I7I50_11709 [Histoplasma capsulatum G186AR]